MRFFSTCAPWLAASLAVAGLLGCTETTDSVTTRPPADWPLVGFVKVDSLPPLLGPSTAGVFPDPLLQQLVRWEEKDVLNPAAVVKDGQVSLLYRAKNKVGRIGKASRIGLAASPDGLHFTRLAQPVLYPAPDAQQRYEWPGGTEDPRMVRAPTTATT